MKLHIRDHGTYGRYLAIHDYKLSSFGGVEVQSKETIATFLEQERAKIELALEQLKDIEKMAQEL